MKNLFFIAAIVLPCSVLAQSNAQQTSTANGTANNAGNAQSVTFTSPPETTTNVNYSGTTTIKNVPSVIGPNLVSSNDTCMGSTSGSANVPGFGISVGTTYTDQNCVRMKKTRELWNYGFQAAALALMCMDAELKDALEVTGVVCPQTARDKPKATQISN